ncbi:hypothetical protein LX16_2842 [Stackebrandtia albiflava]|uniref:Uncharacterized protein n=1 Tax=Stackebrandtia albiflava TaxID=406432 RepID=A0A562V2J2_9ACTN|nr:prevent-host-death protein [Stackebrandtia albiflava]TWJ12094.1 hypothetical protein LX16_2842 [Stackebrandtia albiflava]
MQREPRSSAPGITDAVESDKPSVTTRNGSPIDESTPIRRRTVPVKEVLENFADCPPMDYRRLRDDLDAFFGEQRN